MTITVWDKDEAETDPSVFSPKFWKEEVDDFLGMVHFNVKELIADLRAARDQRVDRWYPLEKRSSRSHVSGQIHILVELFQDAVGVPLPTTAKELQKNPLLSTDSVVPVENIPLMKMEQFPNALHFYRFLLEKLLAMDARSGAGLLGPFSLSAASEAILKEVGERWRVPVLSREIAYFELMASRYQTPMQPDSPETSNIPLSPAIQVLSQLYRRVDGRIQEAWLQLKEMHIVRPAKSETAVDGSTIYTPPVISACGDGVLATEEMQRYAKCLNKLTEFQQWQIQRYKDCFPCDTPSGALVGTLSLLSSLLENNARNYSSGKTAESQDSGLDVATSPSSLDSLKESFQDLLAHLIQAGTTERYIRLNELSFPMQGDAVVHLCRLAEMLLEEVESDLQYFQKPFAA